MQLETATDSKLIFTPGMKVWVVDPLAKNNRLSEITLDMVQWI